MAVSSQTLYTHQDFWHLCHLRFEHWQRCTYKYQESYTDYIKEGKNYPCTSVWYEMKEACSDDMMEYLMELGNVRLANKQDPKDYMSHDVKIPANQYDVPEYTTESRSLTY